MPALPMGYQQNPLHRGERIAGAFFVVVVIFVNHAVMGSATNLLGLGLIVAYLMWAAAIWLNDPLPIVPLYLIGIAVQALHFLEEYLTGFQSKFPAFFDYQWSDKRFLIFNLVWLAVFLLAALGVWLGLRLAYLIVFFFAIAGEIGNGLGHLALSITQRRYFPGLITAPVVLIIGVALLTKLLRTAEHLPDQAGDIQEI